MVLTAAIAAMACSPKEQPSAVSSAELPNDVANLEAVATAARETAATATTPGSVELNDAKLEDKVAVTGEFESPEVSNVAVAITGRVAKVTADKGDRVRAGQPLLMLETQYLELDVRKAKAEVARAKAVLDDAKRELDRKEMLRAKESVPQATLDKTRAAYEQALANLDVANAALGTASQRLTDSVLRAPFDGVVMERKTAAGERLSERQDVAFVLARTTPLLLRFDVPERYLSAVKEGQTVRALADPFPGESFDGKVSVIGQTIDSETRTFFVEARFPNQSGKLRPGLFARVELELK
ncbi:MAG: efflux RND transporter periplasmic adaptor subunit [Acidobacteria bacterium]|nr:efflux RND transporter periplasmic adaptor subunit [Acidobacteriota bacterium]